jgi:hypothetical protein
MPDTAAEGDVWRAVDYGSARRRVRVCAAYGLEARTGVNAAWRNARLSAEAYSDIAGDFARE